MIFVRGCISSQHGNSLFDTTVQFLKPHISVENTGKWCCQSGFSCQARWHITANIGAQVERSGRVFIRWSKHLHTRDVRLSVEGVTDTYHKDFDWSFFFFNVKSKHSHQLFRSLFYVLCRNAHPHSDYYHYTIDLFCAISSTFCSDKGKIPLMLTELRVV